MSPWVYSLAADVTVVVHLAFMAYIVLGEVLIVIGALAGWKWIRNPWFRWTHLAAILIVVAETVAGMGCPLTGWEYDLRTLAGDVGAAAQDRNASFTGRVVRQMLFLCDSLNEGHWAFTALYYGFGALVLVTFLLAPPRRRKAVPAAQPAPAEQPTVLKAESGEARTSAPSPTGR
jgi:hypothetical protein